MRSPTGQPPHMGMKEGLGSAHCETKCNKHTRCDSSDPDLKSKYGIPKELQCERTRAFPIFRNKRDDSLAPSGERSFLHVTLFPPRFSRMPRKRLAFLPFQGVRTLHITGDPRPPPLAAAP
jgi:hypothetical protein